MSARVKMMLRKQLAALAVAVATGGSVFSGAQASTLYFNDFDSAGLPNATAAFTLGSGVLSYVDTAPVGQNPVATASTQVSGIDGPEFVVSTRFTLNSSGTNTANLSTVGFGAFSTAPTFLSTSGNSYYLADWGLNSTAATKGQLRITALGDAAGFTALNADSDTPNPNGSSVVDGATYELRLTGVYAAGTLNMTLALFDSAGTQIGGAATATDASPLVGEYFGFRNRLVSGSGTSSISYDNFRVAEIPEPASLMSAVVAILGLATAARARAARILGIASQS